MEIVIKYPKTMEILTTVLTDEYYFKTNNQTTYMIYVRRSINLALFIFSTEWTRNDILSW